MTITTPRYQQATYFSSGSGTVPVPAGSVVGEVALLNIDGLGSSKRAPVDMTGWISKVHTYSTDSYWTLLTAAHISGGIPIKGYIGFLTVYPGAGRVGNVTDLGNTTPGCNLSVPGSWLHVHGRGDSALTPATGKLGTDVTLTAYSSRRYNVWAQAETTVKYATLAGTFNGRDSNGFEIVPLEGPAAPTVQTPSTGVTLPYNEALTVLFQHNSRRSAPMTTFRVKVVDGATTYYVTAAGALTVTLTTLSGSAGTVTIANTAMTTGKTYDLSIATSEDGTVFSDYSPVVTIYTSTRPTVDTVTVSSPAGSLTPTVSHTATTTGGQVAHQTRICLATDATPDNPIWDSLVTAGADLSVTAPVLPNWPNGVNLKAWKLVQQPGLWSTWLASAAFTVSWTPPTAPSAVTAANQAVGPLRITITGIAGSPAWLELQSSVDGSAWTDLALVASPTATYVKDNPAAPYGATRWYRARVATVASGTNLWSAWTTIAAAVASTDRAAYIIARDGSSYVALRVQRGAGTRNRPQGFATFYAFGAEAPTVFRTPPAGQVGTELVGVGSYAALGTLEDILDGDDPWWWRWSPEIDSTGALVDQPATLATLAGELNYQRLQASILTDRLVPLAWAEQV